MEDKYVHTWWNTVKYSYCRAQELVSGTLNRNKKKGSGET